jgi:hypothetical protein
MTLEQVDQILRALGWNGEIGDGPEVYLNHDYTFGPTWIEKNLVAHDDGVLGKTWMLPSEITTIRPANVREP